MQPQLYNLTPDAALTGGAGSDGSYIRVEQTAATPISLHRPPKDMILWQTLEQIVANVTNEMIISMYGCCGALEDIKSMGSHTFFFLRSKRFRVLVWKHCRLWDRTQVGNI